MSITRISEFQAKPDKAEALRRDGYQITEKER